MPVSTVEELRTEAEARGARARMHLFNGQRAAAQIESERARQLLEIADALAVEPIISIVFTKADVDEYAAAAGIEKDEALRRAREWGPHIQKTAAGLCAEQLQAVVRDGEP